MTNHFKSLVEPLAILALLVLSACATAPGVIDTSKLNRVDANHAKITKGGKTYLLDSYIVPFERPYYILVRKASKEALSLEEASTVAADYIRPRGCTTPLTRQTQLDKFNADKTQWLIGIAC
jgi:hypothetical protein